MIKGLYKFAEKWSEKGAVWMVSDTHFDDPDRELMGYKLNSQEHFDIIRKCVGKNDTLIHLGDVGNPEYMKYIKGYKVLILGNHDFTATKFQPYFDEIYEGPLMIGKKLILSHEPLFVDFAFNIHGHNHNSDKIVSDIYHMNIAANVVEYNPVNLGFVIKSGFLSDIVDIHRQTIDAATTAANIKK